MPKSSFQGIEFIQLWPRKLFTVKSNGKLLIREIVPQLGLPAVYILYQDRLPVYIGRANRLMSRLHSHANKVTSKHFHGWNFFSALVLSEGSKRPAMELALIEALLIVGNPNTRNGAVPRFKKVVIPKPLRKYIQAEQ